MDPVTSKITIGRPREEVFDYLADIANHPEFSNHYLQGWRLTREDSWGEGAGARYRLRRWFNRGTKKALKRLQSILEEDYDRGSRATVAGV